MRELKPIVIGLESGSWCIAFWLCGIELSLRIVLGCLRLVGTNVREVCRIIGVLPAETEDVRSMKWILALRIHKALLKDKANRLPSHCLLLSSTVTERKETCDQPLTEI